MEKQELLKKTFEIHKAINRLMEYDVDNIKIDLDELSRNKMTEYQFKMLSVASIAMEQVIWSLKLASDCCCDVENDLEINKDNYSKEDKHDDKV